VSDDTTRWVGVVRALLAQPTAPLCEDLPRAHVRSVSESAGLAVSEDEAGNVLVRHDGARGDASRPLVLVAHLDHPGFAVEDVAGGEASLAFRGGLAAAAVRPEEAAVHFFAPGERDPVGEGVVAGVVAEGDWLRGARARVTAGDAAPGGFAMWGFPGWTDDDPARIAGRVCDDLVGAAAALAVLVDLAADRAEGVSVWGLFTRGEEMGFLGALEAIRLGVVPTGAAVLSLECSKALPGAPQGGGVIVRVGDRSSIFDPSITEALRAAAQRLADDDPSDGFRFQRRLMDGGACEATAFCAAGYRSSGLALPLGNYHNAADEGGGLAAEHVLIADYVTEVRLLAALAREPGALIAPSGLPPWFAERTRRATELLSGDGR
jgi:putative aminopeptidase FrvX